MPKRYKHRSSADRAQRIIDAIKELHEACYDAWEKDDDLAFGAAYTVAKALNGIASNGEEIEGWSGGSLKQSDAVFAGIKLIESYGADKK